MSNSRFGDLVAVVSSQGELEIVCLADDDAAEFLDSLGIQTWWDFRLDLVESPYEVSMLTSFDAGSFEQFALGELAGAYAVHLPS